MLNKEDFERFSFAFERHLLSLRMKVRRLEEQEEDDLLKIYLNHLEDIIRQLVHGINESIALGNWTPVIDVLADTGISFPNHGAAEDFIISISLERLKKENLNLI